MPLQCPEEKLRLKLPLQRKPQHRAWENPFADVVEGAWYYDSIRYAYENGLIAGYPNGLFGINDTITRGQIATILWRMEESPVVNYAMTFEDVGAGMYYAEAIRWAASEGIVGGYTATQFGRMMPLPVSSLRRSSGATHSTRNMM